MQQVPALPRVTTVDDRPPPRRRAEYAMMAYKRHGFARGTVMTAWRLMRCNPLGGHGYDPPVWPPPGLRFLSWIE